MRGWAGYFLYDPPHSAVRQKLEAGEANGTHQLTALIGDCLLKASHEGGEKFVIHPSTPLLDWPYSGQNSASMICSNGQGQAVGKVASGSPVSAAASMRALR